MLSFSGISRSLGLATLRRNPPNRCKNQTVIEAVASWRSEQIELGAFETPIL
jgi:hypothetical protein